MGTVFAVVVGVVALMILMQLAVAARARALGVMATPSTVEIQGGKIVGYHVGAIPGPVMQRFAHA